MKGKRPSGWIPVLVPWSDIVTVPGWRPEPLDELAECNTLTHFVSCTSRSVLFAGSWNNCEGEMEYGDQTRMPLGVVDWPLKVIGGGWIQRDGSRTKTKGAKDGRE